MSSLAGSSVSNDHGHPDRRDDAYGGGEGARRRVAPWKGAQATLGQRLKAQRERRGIPLEVIAESSKIKVSLLHDLECDDFSRWPRGVFGRGFVRAYATAVGLPAGAVVAEFAELCPDERDGAPPTESTDGGDNDLRLTLAGDGRAVLAHATQRMVLAAIEAGAIVAAGVLGGWVVPQSLWAIAGGLAIVYYATSAALLGQSPSQWWLQRRRTLALRRTDHCADATPRRPLQLIVSRPPTDEEQDPAAISARG